MELSESTNQPLPLNWPELYQRMKEIAGTQENLPKWPHHVYIIKVRSAAGAKKIDFYVGSTGNTLEGRFARHQNREWSAAQIFKSRKYDAVKFKTGWMSQFPKFRNNDDAELAEGIVGEFLRSLGYVVDYSNKPIRQSLAKYSKSNQSED